MNYTKSVEKWGVFGFCSGEPPMATRFWSAVSLRNLTTRTQDRQWFYDGNGIYKVRFMPSFEEEYHFTVCGNFLTGNTKELFLSRRRRKIITAA